MYVDFKRDYEMETFKVKKKIINSKFRVYQWVGVEDKWGLKRSTQKSSNAMVVSFFNSDGNKDIHCTIILLPYLYFLILFKMLNN